MKGFQGSVYIVIINSRVVRSSYLIVILYFKINYELLANNYAQTLMTMLNCARVITFKEVD